LREAGGSSSPLTGKNGYRFSIITRTIFQDTKYPLRTWFQVAFLMLSARKGMPALQVQRILGSSLTNKEGSYETFWYMCHRLRSAMQSGEFRALMGKVEVDETFIGGKDKNRHWSKKSHVRGGSSKTAIIGAISRKGNVVAQMVDNTDTATLEGFVRKTVAHDVTLLATDEHSGYRNLKGTYPHAIVRHGRHEYVVGDTHTN
jgi:hypothetical protein